jgi:hypothetical protein
VLLCAGVARLFSHHPDVELFIHNQSTMTDREEAVYIAKLAEQAERYAGTAAGGSSGAQTCNTRHQHHKTGAS